MLGNRIPNHKKLFKKYIKPWLPSGESPTKPRPDMFQSSLLEQPEGFDIQYLELEKLEESKLHLANQLDAALRDFQKLAGITAISIEGLDSIDKALTESTIKQIIKSSDPSDFSNSYLITVCELGCYIGELFRKQNSQKYQWIYGFPYFQSTIVDLETGWIFPVFDWSVKKLSRYAVDDGQVKKFYHAINN